MNIEIGKIIRGESHTVYWVQIHNIREGEPSPTPEDCAFGNFVVIPCETVGLIKMIGVIMDTMLIDRDALRTGPRLTQNEPMSNILFPDFIEERIKIVRVVLIGYIQENIISHNFPAITPNLGDAVLRFAEDEIKSFHLVEKQFQIGYYSAIMSYGKIFLELIRRILTHLIQLFPEQQALIKVLLNNLEYQLKSEGGL